MKRTITLSLLLGGSLIHTHAGLAAPARLGLAGPPARLALPAPAARKPEWKPISRDLGRLPVGKRPDGRLITIPAVLKRFEAEVQRLDAQGMPRQLTGERTHRLGNTVVTRKYEALPDGKTTRMTQSIMRFLRPIPRNKEDASRIAFEQLVKVIKAKHLRRDQFGVTDMYEAAMRGVVRELPDKYSYILPPAVAEQSIKSDNGQFVGIGVMFAPPKAKGKRKPAAGLDLVKVVRGGPANRAGLHVGDRVIAVEGKKFSSMQEAAELIKGEPDTAVKIRIKRGNATRTIEVKRQVFDWKPVDTRLREGVGYLRLREFDMHAFDKVKAGLDKLTTENGKPLDGLVFDLRGNPGGEVKNALNIANLFVGMGDLATAKMHGGKPMMSAWAVAGDAPYANLPLTVLINRRSVSASELVSGILKAHKRAVVIGETSKGKGTVLSIMRLADGSQLGLTSAYYYLPNGETPHEKGITPDISSKQARANYLRHKDARVGADYVLEEGFAQIKRGNATKLLVEARKAREAGEQKK